MRDGISIGDSQSLLLEKVEELTLYLIEKDQQIASLRAEKDAEISLLKARSQRDIAIGTKSDCVLQCVINSLETNKWHDKICSKSDSFKCYEQLSHELAKLDTSYCEEHGYAYRTNGKKMLSKSHMAVIKVGQKQKCFFVKPRGFHTWTN